MAIFNFATSKSFRNLNDALGRLIQPQISYSSLTTFAIARIVPERCAFPQTMGTSNEWVAKLQAMIREPL